MLPKEKPTSTKSAPITKTTKGSTYILLTVPFLRLRADRTRLRDLRNHRLRITPSKSSGVPWIAPGMRFTAVTRIREVTRKSAPRLPQHIRTKRLKAEHPINIRSEHIPQPQPKTFIHPIPPNFPLKRREPNPKKVLSA